jgi:hypothetical protein
MAFMERPAGGASLGGNWCPARGWTPVFPPWGRGGGGGGGKRADPRAERVRGWLIMAATRSGAGKEEEAITKTGLRRVRPTIWFPSQKKTEMPATHTFLCGGIAVLQNAAQFKDMYLDVARDVLERQGKVVVCENFPRIVGSWPAELIPPPHLVERAALMLHALDKVPSYTVSAERHRQDQAVHGHGAAALWTLCAFAMDFDYGPIAPGHTWWLEDLVADIRVVQRMILECGHYRASDPTEAKTAMCIPCIAFNGNKLGMHLYFPYARYYPEQCMHLATICLFKLNEERPVPRWCSRTWHKIVDLIYNGSLRLPLVQKLKNCAACENVPARRSVCAACQGTGRFWDDRRYYPWGLLNAHGEWHTTEGQWMDRMSDFVRGEPAGFSQQMRAQHLRTPLVVRDERALARATAEQFFRNKLAQSGVAEAAAMGPAAANAVGVIEARLNAERERAWPPMTKAKCAGFALLLLRLCSLRLAATPSHAVFSPRALMPKPTYPRSWLFFFESVLHAAQPPAGLALATSEISRRLAARAALPPPRGPARPATPAAPATGLLGDAGGDDGEGDDGGVLPRLAVTDAAALAPASAARVAGDEGRVAGGAAVGAGGVLSSRAEEKLSRGSSGTAGRAERAIEEQVDELARRLKVLDLRLEPWSNPGGGVATRSVDATQLDAKDRDERGHTVLAKHRSSPYGHLFLTNMDYVAVAKQMVRGPFAEFKTVETITNDPEGRCRRLQVYIRGLSTYYGQLQVLRIHTSVTYKNHLVQVGGPGQHYCRIAGRNHNRNVISFQVRRVGQVLHQLCFHPKCSGKHFDWGAIVWPDLRILLAPQDTIEECEQKVTPELVRSAKSILATSKIYATSTPRKERVRTEACQPPEHLLDNELKDQAAAPLPPRRASLGPPRRAAQRPEAKGGAALSTFSAPKRAPAPAAASRSATASGQSKPRSPSPRDELARGVRAAGLAFPEATRPPSEANAGEEKAAPATLALADDGADGKGSWDALDRLQPPPTSPFDLARATDSDDEEPPGRAPGDKPPGRTPGDKHRTHKEPSKGAKYAKLSLGDALVNPEARHQELPPRTAAPRTAAPTRPDTMPLAARPLGATTPSPAAAAACTQGRPAGGASSEALVVAQDAPPGALARTAIPPGGPPCGQAPGHDGAAALLCETASAALLRETASAAPLGETGSAPRGPTAGPARAPTLAPAPCSLEMPG